MCFFFLCTNKQIESHTHELKALLPAYYFFFDQINSNKNYVLSLRVMMKYELNKLMRVQLCVC